MIAVDGDRCQAYGLSMADVSKALEASGPAIRLQLRPTPRRLSMADVAAGGRGRRDVAELEVPRSVPPSSGRIGAPASQIELEQVPVRQVNAAQVRLKDVAHVKEYLGPAAVYRLDRCWAIRITGAPAEGKSVAAAAARCIDLTEAERKRLGSRGYAVVNLSAK
jgi:multidrug efflux pump subunit AcrB